MDLSTYGRDSCSQAPAWEHFFRSSSFTNYYRKLELPSCVPKLELGNKRTLHKIKSELLSSYYV